MYIIKNALRCISRSKGRNILIGIIAVVIAISACLGLSIRQASENAKATALQGMNVTATISFDRSGAMSGLGGSMFEEGTEKLVCVISEELAIYNGLSVGSTITLVNPAQEEETYTLTVSGFYTSSENNDFSMAGFSKSQDPANRIYMSANALQVRPPCCPCSPVSLHPIPAIFSSTARAFPKSTSILSAPSSSVWCSRASI